LLTTFSITLELTAGSLLRASAHGKVQTDGDNTPAAFAIYDNGAELGNRTHRSPTGPPNRLYSWETTQELSVPFSGRHRFTLGWNYVAATGWMSVYGPLWLSITERPIPPQSNP
jgi:hypothetical protein